MKTLFKVLILCCVFASVLSCKTSNEDPVPNNYGEVEIQEDSYVLVGGLLHNQGLDPYRDYEGEVKKYDGYFMKMYLFSKDYNFVNGERYGEEGPGKGTLLELNLYSSNKERLDQGEYVFSTGMHSPVFSLSLSSYSRDWLPQTTLTTYFIEEGNVNVKKSGEIYEISLDCKDQFNVPIKGYYKGTLQYSDKEGEN